MNSDILRVILRQLSVRAATKRITNLLARKGRRLMIVETSGRENLFVIVELLRL